MNAPHEKPAVRTLVAQPLTREAFAPFGEVIETGAATRQFPINGGDAMRYHDLANVEPGPEGRAIISIFRGRPYALPFTARMMERHPLASQAFVPLSGRPYLVVAAPPGAAPAAADLRAFLARPDQGVNYAPGVWHHPLLALEAVSDFLIVDRAGPGQNCDEMALDEPVRIALG